VFPVRSRIAVRFVLPLAIAVAAGVAPSAAFSKRMPNALAAGGSGGSALAIHKQSKSTDPTDVPIVQQNGGSAHLGNRTLRPGMHGHDVRVLQGYLSMVGFPTTVDGSYGPATKAKVLAFQQTHSMKANGVVTFAETLVLRQAVAAVLASGPVTSGPVSRARINSDGTATAPTSAPAVVQKVVAAANQIIDKPYIYAGGHASWKANGYDCSGAVSYALHGAGLLSSPEDSTGLESWGSAGPGKWITVYADAQHTFVVVAGRAFDTADYGGPNIPSGTGPRWRSNPTGNLADGGDYVVRHPAGL
jgi:peptidoglycan hydrolase-like protein with peptidoglycan-binding domain